MATGHEKTMFLLKVTLFQQLQVWSVLANNKNIRH